MKRFTRIACAALGALLLVACGSREPSTRGGPPTLRLLTESQYRNVIADVFGEHIEVAARFDPIVRVEGLLAIGAGRATVTPFGVERYIALARSIATQVMAEGNRELLVSCQPAQGATFDAQCAERFIAHRALSFSSAARGSRSRVVRATRRARRRHSRGFPRGSRVRIAGDAGIAGIPVRR